MKVTKVILRKTSWRLILAWLFLSACVLFQGEHLSRPILPLVSSVIDMIQSDYRTALTISSDQPDLIQMQATTRHSIHSIVATGARLTAGIHVSHALVPLVLFFSILLAWPVKKYQKRIVLLLLGIPLSFGLIALTLPFQFAGSIENMFQAYAQQYGATRGKPLLLNWVIFLEVGGRWLLAIVLAVISCLLVQAIGSKKKRILAYKKKQKNKRNR